MSTKRKKLKPRGGNGPQLPHRRIKMSIPAPEDTILSEGAAKAMVGRKTKIRVGEDLHPVRITGAEIEKDGTAMIITVSVPEHLARRLEL